MNLFLNINMLPPRVKGAGVASGKAVAGTIRLPETTFHAP